MFHDLCCAVLALELRRDGAGYSAGTIGRVLWKWLAWALRAELLRTDYCGGAGVSVGEAGLQQL